MADQTEKPTKQVRDYLSAIGQRGGRARTPKQLAAVKKNLVHAREKRWPGRPQPFLPDAEPQVVNSAPVSVPFDPAL